VDYRQVPGVDLAEFQRLVISSRYLDGECGFVMLENGQLQPIEAELIRTPEKKNDNDLIIEGVRKSKSGIVLGYYICGRTSNGSADQTKTKFIPKENFIHCFKPIRFDQVRAVPDLAPLVNKLRDYDETDGAVLNKVKLDAYQQFKRKTNTGLANERARDAYVKTDSDSKDKQRVEKHEQWRIHNMRPHEDLEAFASATPSNQYVEYLKHELTAIAAALGIPYEYLMLIFTAGSFSAQRAAMLHAQHEFLQIHNWVINVFLDRLYNWRIAKAIKEGDLAPAPVDERGISEWYKKKWSAPYFGWVDPQKQVAADKDSFNMGITSLKAIVNNQGRDRDEVLAEKAGDIQEAIRLAALVNSDVGQDIVTWRDLITTEIPGQVMRESMKEDQ